MSELPIGTIRNIVYGDDGFDFDKCDPDADTNADIKKQFHDAEVSNAVGKSSGACVAFDWAAPSESDADAEEPEFWRAPRVIRHGEAASPSPDALTKAARTPMTLAKKLGITRTEEVVAASGDKWVHAYNAANELVHARLLESAE